MYTDCSYIPLVSWTSHLFHSLSPFFFSLSCLPFPFPHDPFSIAIDVFALLFLYHSLWNILYSSSPSLSYRPFFRVRYWPFHIESILLTASSYLFLVMAGDERGDGYWNVNDSILYTKTSLPDCEDPGDSARFVITYVLCTKSNIARI